MFCDNEKGEMKQQVWEEIPNVIEIRGGEEEVTSRISGFAGPQRQERSSEDGENVRSEPGPWRASAFSHYTDDKTKARDLL